MRAQYEPGDGRARNLQYAALDSKACKPSRVVILILSPQFKRSRTTNSPKEQQCELRSKQASILEVPSKKVEAHAIGP